MKRLVLLIPWALVSIALPAFALVIDDADLGASKMIPREADRVRLLVPVLNDAEEAFQGQVTVALRSARRGERLGEPVRETRELDLKPGEAADYGFEWSPPRNGYYRLVLEIEPAGSQVVREIAVTSHDVYFVWFGAPKEFRWCNVPTTVKPEDRDWWLRRGAIPAAWKRGVCYKEWPVEKFVENWGASDWIAIDEIGGPGEVTDKFIEAWRRLKQQKPHQWMAVWYMGAHAYWGEVKDLVDLFLPEIYLNYRGNHLGQFDAYLRVARQAGVLDQTIPALGINQVKNQQGRVTNSPSRADVLRQVRYLKRTAPDLRGIGFFNAGGAAPGVAQYADALCEDYFVKPVLTIEAIQDPFTVSGGPTDEQRVISVRVRNVGNMDASNVGVEWRWGWPEQGATLTAQEIAEWAVDEQKTLSIEVRPDLGWWPVEFRIVPRPAYTVLDGVATYYMIRPPADLAEAVTVVIPRGTLEPGTAVALAPVAARGPCRLVEMTPAGDSRELDAPCAVLPPRPGMDETLAAFAAGSVPERPRVVFIQPGGAAGGAGPVHTLDATVLTVSNEYYEARLDLASDRLLSLGLRGGMANLLREPWQLLATGHDGFGEATVEELPGCLVVTVPYSSAQASGASQYLFFSYSPAVRVARSWVPQGEVTMTSAGDRCGLFQQGGSFARQPGVGGPVHRGRLHDGNDYRDLLFGYLGERPRPDNADRAGWIDFSYGAENAEGGLGVTIEYRWEDSDARSYDVTRLYDASDWLEVPFLWGKEKTFTQPQRSCVWLIPHRRMDFTDEAVTPPAQALWNQLHADQLAATGET